MDTPAPPASISPPPARAAAWGALVFLFCLALFGLTGSKLRFGYLGETIGQAEAIVSGSLHRGAQGLEPAARVGVVELVPYLPAAALRLALERRGALPGLRDLAYVWVEPLTAALLVLAFYGLALRLYRRPRTAGFLALTLALATFIWPYSKFGMENMITLWTVVAAWALVGYAGAPSLGRAVWFAAALVAVTLTKVTGPLHAAALGGAALWLAARGGWARRPGFGRDLGVALAILAAGAAVFLFTNHLRYGGWLWGSRYVLGNEMRPWPLWQSIPAFLISPNKSVFLFSPPALLALWFWGGLWRRCPALRPIVLGLLLVALFHLLARTWAEETWGPRRLHFLVPFAVLPLGIWWERRAALGAWVRRLGWGALALGVLVQGIAVAYDYTALSFVLGHNPRFTQENYVWNPDYNAIAFNLRLIHSELHAARTGQPLPVVLEPHYMTWTYRPGVEGPPVEPQVYPTAHYAHLDLWYLQQRADWPERPYWFHAASSYLAIALALAALFCAAILARWLAGGMDDIDPMDERSV